ncbi:coiled-coil domain-containing protein [Wolbachia endosymbiont of Tribolium confusum]|uniref:hypothetical protein n=1 Tax=Wolbachia endosymbiont of Tribolium confusum TaxID=214474 RepID=UPI001CF4278B|nr:hypothetical protein [Wolbachia endosymbiont of Tribolium confusum]MCA7010816.1 hypothetical protein [Wolbachia endosymbiont of Tribolium confusum]
MLNANNKVNYESSIKQKEKKYSLSTVFAWLYLKTIGQMLPGRWNKWAENILHHNQVIVVNGVQTDNLFNSDREKELKDENEKLQEKLKEMNELTEQVKSLGEEKEIFAKFFAAQAQQIEDLELENEELKSKLEEIKKSYKELEAITQKRGEEFLAQFKEKSKEILDSQKELIERSKEFANKIEMLTVEIEKKDGKIRSLTQLNEVLEQEKKEMEDKNNAQQQIILDQEEKIEKQSALITSLTDKNKDINETVKKDNESLRAQNTDLESKVSQLKNESDTKIKELKNQLEEKQAELEQAKKKNTEVEDLTRGLKGAQKQLEQEKTNLKDELKDSSSKLNATKEEKKELESKITSLQEQVQTLEKVTTELVKKDKQIEQLQEERKQAEDQAKADITKLQEKKEALLDEIDNLKRDLSIVKEQSQKQLLLNNQEQQKSKNELKDVDKKLEGIDEKTKVLDTMSTIPTVQSTTGSSKSTFLKFQNLTNKLLGNEDLKNLLSKKNEELKKGFPEFKGEHFCHKVLEKTIQSLLYQNDYKFKSDQLLELLESNLMKSARTIIETKVNKVVEELAKDFVKKHDLKQVILVERCAEKLYLNEEDSKAILNSFTGFLANRNDSNNDSVKKFVVQKLTEAEMKCFSDKIQGLQLASSIRDKFLSPDQGMCNQTQGGVNEYQLTEKAKKEYKLTPNPSMSHTNSTPVSVKQEATSR